MNPVFPLRLKLARERLSMTQLQVVKHTRMNNKTLSNYEKGRSEPDFDTLVKLSDLYNVSVDWLLGRTENNLDTYSTSTIVPSKIELSNETFLSISDVYINGIILSKEQKRKIAALSLILFGED